MEQEEGNFSTVNLSDLRCRHKEQEAPLKSLRDASLTVQGRAPWLPGPARAHTGGIDSLAAGHSPAGPPHVPPAADRTLCLRSWVKPAQN